MLAAMAGDILIVVGLDACGLSAVQLGASLGLTVLSVDVGQTRLDAARRCGARMVFDATGSSPENLASLVARFLHTEGLHAARVHVVVSGTSPSLLEHGLALAEHGGIVSLTGAWKAGLLLPLDRLVGRGLSLFAVRHGHPDLLAECLALCARGAVSLNPITRPVAPQDLAHGVSAEPHLPQALPVVCFEGSSSRTAD